MSDLDYAKVIGRFGLNIGDTTDDLDDNPDTIWCDEGRVILTPLVGVVRVPGGTPVPWTAGNAAVECLIDADGYLTYNETASVYVVDLTSDKVNPSVPEGVATHRVTFSDVKAASIPVAFPPLSCRLTATGDGISPGGANDLNLVTPISTQTP